MFRHLNMYYISAIFIQIILFHILFNPINSISGTSSEVFSLDPDSDKSTKNNEICPCDVTEGTCDPGCICDQDCFDLMLSNDYFSSYQIDEASYTEQNIHSKLDYCDEYIESVDDLYNPLILAFKILKRGFCLVYENTEDYEENTKNFDEFKKKYETESDNDNNKSNNYTFEEYYSGENDFDDFSKKDSFDAINISVPIALPNGLCLFHSHLIKKNIDYEVACSYKGNLRDKIWNEFGYNINENLNFIKKYYIIEDYYYSIDENFTKSDYSVIKKVEILHYVNDSNTLINYYYENITDDNINETYFDLIVEVKFLFDEQDFRFSGNPGYIKGKPIIFGTNDTEVISKGIVFPFENNNMVYNDKVQNIYFNNYVDNKITFEDLIIYGYNSGGSGDVLSALFGKEGKFNFTQFGNAKNRKPVSKNYNNGQNFVMIGKYKDSGTVNNTQFQMYSLEFVENQYSGAENINLHNSYHYFIIKFVKLETETRWWYAPGPIIINLPRNIMYPFKIGTSRYKR